MTDERKNEIRKLTEKYETRSAMLLAVFVTLFYTLVTISDRMAFSIVPLIVTFVIAFILSAIIFAFLIENAFKLALCAFSLINDMDLFELLPNTSLLKFKGHHGTAETEVNESETH